MLYIAGSKTKIDDSHNDYLASLLSRPLLKCRVTVEVDIANLAEKCIYNTQGTLARSTDIAKLFEQDGTEEQGDTQGTGGL